ncbi:MAG: hypothetical protein OXE52_12640 [Chloroflexi bacterium]|nr:hypothetical protein [Chloroflexota bacterium]
MQNAARLLVGILSFGVAVYAAINQYPFEYTAGFLLFSALLLTNVQWFRAKAADGEVELEAHFEELDDTAHSGQESGDAIDRLSERDTRKAVAESDNRDSNELESPTR